MEQKPVDAFDMKKMIADSIENGYLENVIDMFKHDESLYAYVGDFLADERMRVRIGIIALLETLKKEEPEKTRKSLPSILSLLKNDNPVVRGDAAYLLGIVGDKDTIPMLEEILSDKDANVRLIAKEAIDDIHKALDPFNAFG